MKIFRVVVIDLWRRNCSCLHVWHKMGTKPKFQAFEVKLDFERINMRMMKFYFKKIEFIEYNMIWHQILSLWHRNRFD